MEGCISAFIGLKQPQPFLMLHFSELSHDINIDNEMDTKGYIGFCIHTDVDVLICGLNRTASSQAFEKMAIHRNEKSVIDDCQSMISLIGKQAKKEKKTFNISDDYTTRFGYSTNQMGPLYRKSYSDNFLQVSFVRGGATQQAFLKTNQLLPHPNIVTTRVGMRMQMVEPGKEVSPEFLKWTDCGRPRVTANFQGNNIYVRCPFTLNNSLPKKLDLNLVKLATWETTLRAIEEDLMVSLFGMLPNVIWGRIMVKVMERTAVKLGDFDREAFIKWILNGKEGKPPNLGFPARGCASRLLPKGATGVSANKPMHDDNNGVISLSFWTSLTESNEAVDLIFLVNGKRVRIGATCLRWVLFMGYIPHETRSSDEKLPAKKPRLHHSSFVKPEVEYLATHILSTLPCNEGGDDWSLEHVNSVNGLRDDIELLPIAPKKKY